jgi:hypothetical protein
MEWTHQRPTMAVCSGNHIASIELLDADASRLSINRPTKPGRHVGAVTLPGRVGSLRRCFHPFQGFADPAGTPPPRVTDPSGKSLG